MCSFQAIKRGSLNAVISWIYYKDGKCDEYKHWDGSTALHLAAEFNEVEIAEKLIRDGAGRFVVSFAPHLLSIRMNVSNIK